ncbi:prolyl-tRNA synthetase associated domain-containing protein [Pelagibius sp.]|uniref:prolyl-tRNA synthetase associated domain-containing protein n=1 Tax=Pelagibius sp. TaxID=1931238 RepID=UPI003B511F55
MAETGSTQDAESAALPTSPEALLARLDGLGIEARTVSHPPVYTVEQAKALRGELPGAHIKNLFLRNKKGAMWLVTCLEDRDIDLKALGQRLEAGRFSFGSAERLMTYLGVLPGSVTPFAVINDSRQAVTMVLDSGVLDHDLVNCHPLMNDRTTAISPGDLLRFLEAENHSPQMIDMAG